MNFSVRKGAMALCVLPLVACMTIQTTHSGAVGVDRQQFITVSAAEVEKSAVQAYSEIIEKAKKEGKLNKNPNEVSRVRAIAHRLITQTKVFRDDAPNWSWEVNVLTSDELNAWCMAGGKIAFYSALIEKLKLTDDEIAAVMGHEISHALREHVREQISQEMATSLGLSILSLSLGLSSSASNMAGMVAKVTIGLPYSRKHEAEADRMGVELAARAGYNPHAAVSLWEKMSSLGGGAPPEFLSTHPAPDNRMHDLAEYSARVMPLYEQSRKR